VKRLRRLLGAKNKETSATTLVAALVLLFAWSVTTAQDVDESLKSILTIEQQSVLNLKAMTPAQKQTLFDVLEFVYNRGVDEGRRAAPKSAPTTLAPSNKEQLTVPK
jgi:hypothetical protein